MTIAFSGAAGASAASLGAASGTATGSINALFLAGYALALWYGGVSVRAGTRAPGEVIGALFAAMNAGFALALAAPAAQAWAVAVAAGGRLFAVIDGCGRAEGEAA